MKKSQTQNPTTMSSRSRIVKIFLSLVAIIALIIALWWHFKPKQETPDYITSEVTQSDIQETVLATGTLDATKIVSVGAQVSGQVKKMLVSLGQEVKAGDLIAQIDSTTQVNSLKTAEANIQNLEAQRLQQVANLTQVKQEYLRQKQMYAQDATSKADYESALAAYQTAQAQITSIDAQILSAQVTRDTAQTNIGYTRIEAPMDGTIVAIVTEEGQTVNANQSTPTIVKLAKLNTMTIKAEISEADVMKIEQGQTVFFTTLGDSETKHYATLRQIEPAPDSISDDSSSSSSSSSSTAIYYNALFDVPNPNGKLRIDMTANVTVILREAKNALTVPAAAIINLNKNAPRNTNTVAQGDQANGSQPPRPQRLSLTNSEQQQLKTGQANLAMVRVQQADGSVRPQQILVGINNRVNAEVIKGLNKGDRVVIADGSDSSNNSAKSSNRRSFGPPPMGM